MDSHSVIATKATNRNIYVISGLAKTTKFFGDFSRLEAIEAAIHDPNTPDQECGNRMGIYILVNNNKVKPYETFMRTDRLCASTRSVSNHVSTA
jgi:hypothetical protein